MVRQGARVEATVTGTVREGWLSFGTSESDLRNGVLQAFAGRVAVDALTIESDASWRTNTWSYRAIATVRTLSDHARVEDVLGIVGGAFGQVAGTMPIVTLGAWTQADPRQPADDSLFGIGTSLSLVAVIVVGALVLIIWAKP